MVTVLLNLGIMNPDTNKAGIIKIPYDIINPDHQECGRSIYLYSNI
jgi:hypothetical protein